MIGSLVCRMADPADIIERRTAKGIGAGCKYGTVARFEMFDVFCVIAPCDISARQGCAADYAPCRPAARGVIVVAAVAGAARGFQDTVDMSGP